MWHRALQVRIGRVLPSFE